MALAVANLRSRQIFNACVVLFPFQMKSENEFNLIEFSPTSCCDLIGFDIE